MQIVSFVQFRPITKFFVGILVLQFDSLSFHFFYYSMFVKVDKRSGLCISYHHCKLFLGALWCLIFLRHTNTHTYLLTYYYQKWHHVIHIGRKSSLVHSADLCRGRLGLVGLGLGLGLWICYVTAECTRLFNPLGQCVLLCGKVSGLMSFGQLESSSFIMTVTWWK